MSVLRHAAVGRSAVVAVIAAAALAGPDLGQQPPGYCVDFPQAVCARMTVVIESKVRPAYCKPGAVQDGPCTAMTPLMRDQLRQSVLVLARR